MVRQPLDLLNTNVGDILFAILPMCPFRIPVNMLMDVDAPSRLSRVRGLRIIYLVALSSTSYLQICLELNLVNSVISRA